VLYYLILAVVVVSWRLVTMAVVVICFLPKEVAVICFLPKEGCGGDDGCTSQFSRVWIFPV